jgi:hypothetical protein
MQDRENVDDEIMNLLQINKVRTDKKNLLVND